MRSTYLLFGVIALGAVFSILYRTSKVSFPEGLSYKPDALHFAQSSASFQNEPSIQLDLSRLYPYTSLLELFRPYSYPYEAGFKRYERELHFLAVEHWTGPTSNIPTAFDHPTFKAIQKEFDTFHPTVVIFEGLSLATLSKEVLQERADDCKSRQYLDCGEAFFAINLARNENIAFVSGEPKPHTLVSQLLKRGYTVSDIIGRFLLADLAEEKISKGITPENFQEWAESEIQWIKKRFNFNFVFGVKDFQLWYANRVHRPVNYLEIEGSDLSPDAVLNRSFLHKISSHIRMIRDQQILLSIEAQLNHSFPTRVLVVFGGGHLLTQEPVLKNALGKPVHVPLNQQN